MEPRNPAGNVLAVGFVGCTEARAKLRFLDPNHDPMSEECEEDRPAQEPETAEIECFAPDHHHLRRDDRISNQAMESVDDQISRRIRRRWSAASSTAEGIEANDPQSHTNREQGSAAPCSEKRRKWELYGQKVMSRRGESDHEEAKEEGRVE